MTYHDDILSHIGGLQDCGMQTPASRILLSLFAKRLKGLRKRANYKSAKQFADKIGVAEHTYRKFERGEKLPEIDELAAICLALRLTPNDLLPELTTGSKKESA